MFNLDQAIAEWRRRMLAAGIKTPVPLDELEAHLRDEIEQQAKSGLSEAEAFQAAIKEIGKAQPLQQEFKKVEKGHKIIRAIVLVIGWLAASYALAYGLGLWEFDWNNIFGFSVEWNLPWIWAMLWLLVALTAIWFLAKASRDKASRAVSLLVCVLFAGFALMALRPEAPNRGFLGLGPSPLWFRGALSLVLCVPGAFWFWWMRRHLARKRGSTRGSQPIQSD